MTKYIKDSQGKFAGSVGEGRDNTPKAAPAVKKVSEGEGASYHARRDALGAKLSQPPTPTVYLNELAILDKFPREQEQLDAKRARDNLFRSQEKAREDAAAGLHAPGYFLGYPDWRAPSSPQIQDQLQQVATDELALLETYTEAAGNLNNATLVMDATDNLVEKLAQVPSRDSKVSKGSWLYSNRSAFYGLSKTNSVVWAVNHNARDFSDAELRDFAEDFAVIGAAPVAKPAFFSKMKRDGETFFVSVYEEDGDFYIETTHAQSSETYREVVTDANKRAIAEKLIEVADKPYQDYQERELLRAQRYEELHRLSENNPDAFRLQKEAVDLEERRNKLSKEWDKVWGKRHAEDARVEQERHAEDARVEQERQAEEKARRKARRKEIWTGPLFKKSN